VLVRFALSVIPPEDADHLAALKQHQVERQLGDLTAGKADDEKASIPTGRTERLFGKFAADWVIDDINPFAAGHLLERVLDVEVAEGADSRDRVARLEVPDIRRSHTRLAVLSRWRSSDPHVELQVSIRLRVARKRVVPPRRRPIARLILKDVIAPPDRIERLWNIALNACRYTVILNRWREGMLTLSDFTPK